MSLEAYALVALVGVALTLERFGPPLLRRWAERHAKPSSPAFTLAERETLPPIRIINQSDLGKTIDPFEARPGFGITCEEDGSFGTNDDLGRWLGDFDTLDQAKTYLERLIKNRAEAAHR